MTNELTISKQQAFDLFFEVYKTVPAYTDFIDRRIKVKTIKSIADFEQIPQTDRHNYINKYPLDQRLRQHNKPSDYYLITASSGSTGKPTYWLKDQSINNQLGLLKENFYKQYFNVDQHTTLVVITFAMGMWLAGILEMLLAFEVAKKHKLTVVTPGMNLSTTINVLKDLSSHYEQTIILGYPPFVGDLIEKAQDERLPINKMNLKFVLTGEGFTENWRQKIKTSIGSDTNQVDIIGLYACSDAGILGNETPWTINMMQKIQSEPHLIKEYFNSTKTPNLVLYPPKPKFLETINNEIIFTTNQPAPLIRYNLHDRGLLLTGQQLRSLADTLQIDTTSEDLLGHYLCVYGRTDSIVNIANIYIDDIKYCLEKSYLAPSLTFNFKFGNIATKSLKSRVKIIVYTKIAPSFTKRQKGKFEKEFYDHLASVNADFKEVRNKISRFAFVFKPDAADRFKNNKLKYFL